MVPQDIRVAPEGADSCHGTTEVRRAVGRNWRVGQNPRFRRIVVLVVEYLNTPTRRRLLTRQTLPQIWS